MKPHPRNFVVAIGAWVVVGWVEATAAQELGLRAFLEQQRDAGRLPGLAVAVVDYQGFAWSAGLGWAEIGVRPVSADTPFLVASVSKPVTATALVAAVEDGVLALDEDLRGAFGFPLGHPFYPDDPITARELLAHASSVVDDPARLAAVVAPGDPTVNLGEFLADYFPPGEDRSWATRRPGTAFAYSNVGYALAGHLLEVRTGESFGAFLARRLFAPLGMTDSAWTLAGLSRPAAVPYRDTAAGFVPFEPYGVPYAPAVLLRTSARDLGRFLAFHLAQGRVGDQQVVSAAGIAEMQRAQFPISGRQGLGWRYLNAGRTLVLGHGGSGSGVTAEIVIDRRRHRGVAVVTNVDATTGEAARAFQAILDRLLAETEFEVDEPPPPPPSPEARTWLLPGVIRGHRGGELEYRTDLWLVNPDPATPLAVAVAFLPRGVATATAAVTVNLAPGEGRELVDVLATFFGRTAAQGTLELQVAPGAVRTPGLTALARIAAVGGPGQWLVAEELAGTEGERWLVGLRQGDGFEATLAVQNGEAHDQEVTLEAWDADGRPLGSARVALGPRGYRSLRFAASFPAAGQGFFSVRAVGPGRFVVAANLAESSSGDLVPLAAIVPAQAGELLVPRVVRGRGQRGAQLATELALHNPTDVTIDVQVEFRPRGNQSGPAHRTTFQIGPRRTRGFSEGLGELFGLTGDGAGALVVTGSGEATPLLVSARLLLVTAGGPRLGTALPVLEAASAGERRVFGAAWGAGRDSSVGLVHLGAVPIELDLVLYGPDGAERGRRRVGLGPNQHLERTLIGLFGAQAPFAGGTVATEGAGASAVVLYLASLDAGGDVDVLLGSGGVE
ncbi:MAG: serine hydrolase domain-containing protein [Thermoanaerobaculia bacterium]|nr:serine hydrolase domain-containing protein [Thermoanaerobaculia bacterium]